MAESTLYARTLCNTRAFIANPEYMEKSARVLAEGKPGVKSFTVIKGQ